MACIAIARMLFGELGDAVQASALALRVAILGEG
jgi:hypothetical protein